MLERPLDPQGGARFNGFGIADLAGCPTHFPGGIYSASQRGAWACKRMLSSQSALRLAMGRCEAGKIASAGLLIAGRVKISGLRNTKSRTFVDAFSLLDDYNYTSRAHVVCKAAPHARSQRFQRHVIKAQSMRRDLTCFTQDSTYLAFL